MQNVHCFPWLTEKYHSDNKELLRTFESFTEVNGESKKQENYMILLEQYLLIQCGSNEQRLSFLALCLVCRKKSVREHKFFVVDDNFSVHSVSVRVKRKLGGGNDQFNIV